MSINISHDGRPITARMPKMAELNPVLDAPTKPLVYKALASACCVSPTLHELSKGKPACGPAIGLVLATATGLFAAVTPLVASEDAETNEVPAEVAAVMVAMKAKGLTELFPVVTLVGGITRHFVLSMPGEKKVDAYLRTESVEAAKVLVEAVTVYPTKEMGGVASLEQEAPGLYVPLAKYILERAGLVDDVIVGEA